MTLRAALALALLCWTAQATPVRTIDGDTFVADAHVWLGLTSRETIRLLGVNSPERKGATLAAGNAARAFTAAWLLVGGGNVNVEACSRDSFGRVLGKVTRGDGHELGADLVAAGHATLR